MANRADEAVVLAREPFQGLADDQVGAAGAVSVSGDQRVDPATGAKQINQPLLLDLLAEVHEAPSGP